MGNGTGYTLTSTSSLGLATFAFPFTPGVFGATGVNATSTALQLQGGLFASSTVRFGNAGISPFLFNSTVGNLGLGTTSPFAKLSVQANYGDTAATLFAIGSSTAADGSTNTNLFSVDDTGLTTIGSPAGTGDANIQFAGDNNAWSVGSYAGDNSFRIASSSNLANGVDFALTKSAIWGWAGTTTPVSTLSVQGNGYISSNLFVGGNIISTSSIASTFRLPRPPSSPQSGTPRRPPSSSFLRPAARPDARPLTL